MSKKKSQKEVEEELVGQFEEKKAKAEEQRKANKHLEFMKIALENPPYASESNDVIQKYVFLVHQGLQNFSVDKIDQELFAQLSEDELMNLFDYMNKSFELISLGAQLPYSGKVNSTYFLKMFGKFVDFGGKSIILRGSCRKRSMVFKVDQWSN